VDLEKLFCDGSYQKTNPLQTMHGLQFGLSQPQTNDWIHHLLPVLQRAWKKVEDGMVGFVNVKTDYRARATTVRFSSRET